MKAELWQHPFVEVFKLVNLNEWRVCQKEGDVSEVNDKVLGKKVYRVQGQISAANYIQIPRKKSQLKTLGLTGQYIYIQMRQVPEKFFSLHFEISLKNTKNFDENFRISLSNVFKETKLTQNNLQILCNTFEKWGIVVIDLKKLLKKYIGSFVNHYVMKGITICSTIYIKEIFTSDNLYEVSKLPKEMALRLGKDQNWEENYEWVMCGVEGDFEENTDENDVEGKYMFQITEEEQDLEVVTKNKQDLLKEIKEEQKNLEIAVEKPQEKVVLEKRPVKNAYPEVKPQIVAKEVKPEAKKEPDLMSPDPLISLCHIIGFSGVNPRCVKWSKSSSNFTCYSREFTSNSNIFIIYPSGSTVVLMNPITRKQHFLFGHTSSINSLNISRDGSFIVTGQSLPALALVWEIKTMKAPVHLSSAKINTLKMVDISHDNKHVVVAGIDDKKRETIVIWDISGKNPEIKAKQISNFNINTIKFSTIDSERLVSCGKENIRSWRINKDHLSGKSVSLSQHSRSSEFFDLDFEVYSGQSDDNYSKRIFVVSSQGMLFQLNYETCDLEGVLQLHDLAINSIVISQGYCVTGSDDCFLRVWPLDFSEYLLEAKHEGPVVSVDISSDRYNIVCGTLNCTIGYLDMHSNAYRTLLRSHTSPVVAVDIHPQYGTLLTASYDKTLRIWSPDNYEEQFEFYSPQDMPTCVSFHPTTKFFVCGFESGSVRIFEIETTAMKEEFLQHESKVVKCCHSLDAKFLMSASDDGTVCLYDANRKYQPVKIIPAEVLGDKIDTCFSYDSKQFAVLGTHSSIIFIWDLVTFAQKFRINTSGFVIQKILFSPNGQDLLVISSGQEYKVKFYGLNGFEAIFIKEFSGCHAFSEINEIAVSANSKYLVTGGNDKIIKVWEYAARPNSLRSQGFVGHSFGVTHLRFSLDRHYLISCSAGNEGIFVWKFNGDLNNLQAPWVLNN